MNYKILDSNRKIDNITYLNNKLNEVKNIKIGGKDITLIPGINAVNLEEDFIQNLLNNTWRWLEKVDGETQLENSNYDNIIGDLDENELDSIINEVNETEEVKENDEVNETYNDDIQEDMVDSIINDLNNEIPKTIEEDIVEDIIETPITEVKEVKEVKKTTKKVIKKVK